jgi:phosphoribosylamine--glycine ligase
MSGVEILVLGSGGREHALAWRLSRDDGVRRIRVAPGNGGTRAIGEAVDDLDPTDPRAVVRHAAREGYGLVVIGPEAPLAAGVADALEQAAIPVFGPTAAAARLESSKAYAKDQMRRAGVATADGEAFSDVERARARARAMTAAGGVVVKADWLAGGKGVVVADTAAEAEAAIEALMGDARPGAQLVLEERLEGREVSAFALVSGEAVVPLAAVCDYKRLGDGDIGPNTGGMGAYAPVPWFGPRPMDEAVASVFEPIAWRMARDGVPFRGVLYAGLMLTDAGPVVLEFNARFGDPEAQVLFPMVDGDLSAALLATASGDFRMMEESIGMRSGAAVGVVIASGGYPDAPVLGRELTGAEPASSSDDGDVLCFHAGTRSVSGGGYETSGGRVVTFVGRGPNLDAAREAAYRGVAGCGLENSQHRTDIAARELGAKAVMDLQPS